MTFPIELDRIARNEISDRAIRGILRYGLARELALRTEGGSQAMLARKRELVEELRKGPIAVAQAEANQQHYEVPARLFELSLGARRKYSCCYYPPGCTSLDEAELAMLERTVEMADLCDGQRILELGCGWGSLTLYMAERFPRASIVAVSNSRSQRATILSLAAKAGLSNIEVVTTDVTTWSGAGKFDRIVSVEMLEHIRNYEVMLSRMASWLTPGGSCFVHIFAHRELAYVFDSGWTAERFFTGGIMPSVDLFSYFSDDLRVAEIQVIDGTHYQRTAEAWLEKLDRNRDAVIDVLRDEGRSQEEAVRTFAEWRLFYLLTAESFGFREGQEWVVAHYRLEKRR